MRVLVISHLYPSNVDKTAGIFVHEQIKAVIREGCEVRVISPVPFAPRIFWSNSKKRVYGEIPSSCSIEGISVFYPRYLRLPGKWFHGVSSYTLYFGSLKVVNSIIKEFKPHLLHAYTATPDGYSGILFGRKFHLPLICSLLGSDINLYPEYKPLSFHLTKEVIAEADQIVSVSNTLKSTAEKFAQPRDRIQVVYMGCDLKSFKYSEEARRKVREQLKIPPTARVLIFIGNIKKNKGVFELMEAFTQLNKCYSDLHLIYVGDGKERKKLVEEKVKGELRKKVHFVGEKPYIEIPAWLSASDIFAFPSYHEGLPNVVVEALACKRPVVATRVGGIPEVVEEGKSGILINKGDISSLVKSIKELLECAEKRMAMGAYGRKKIEAHFSREKSSKKLVGIYEEVLLRKRKF